MRKNIHKRHRLAANTALLAAAVSWVANTAVQAQNVADIGFMKAEQWLNIPSNSQIADAIADPHFADAPDVVRYVNGFSFGETTNFGNTWNDNHLVRITGIFTAPESGTFRFFIRSDDASALFVKQGTTFPDPAVDLAIANETGCCATFQDVAADGTTPEETSAPMELVAGTKYALAFFVKEGTGGDWGQVAIRKEGDTTPAASLPPLRGGVITSSHNITGANVALTTSPTSQTVSANSAVTFTATATGSSPNGADYGNAVVYQWYKNGVAIMGANGASYTIPVALASMDGTKYRVAAAVAGASTLSDEATLTVTTDTTIPTVVSANPALSLDKVVIRFSEPVLAPSATTLGNYTLTGLTVSAATQLNATTVELTTSRQTLGASYPFTVKGVRDAANLASDFTGEFRTIANGVGFLLAEQWRNFVDAAAAGASAGARDAAAIEAATRPADVVRWVNGFSFGETSNFGDTWGEQHLVKISGVFTPPEGGNYRFFVRSDDASALYINVDGAALPDPTVSFPIAEETGCCNAFQEIAEDGTKPNQTSEVVALQAGKSYGLAFLVKEGGGGDWGQVAVRKEGDTTVASNLQPLRGAVVSAPVDPNGASVQLTKVPTDVSAPANSTLTFSAEATGSSPLGAAYGNVVVYQWYRDGKPILGATGPNYTIPLVALADNGAKFAVGAGVAGAAVLSSEFTLSVTVDNTPPSVTGLAGSITFDTVTVSFSEPVTDSALNASRYTIAGLTVSNAVRVNDRTIRLTTTKQDENKDYAVTVNGVLDLAGNPSAFTGSVRSFKWASAIVTYKTWQGQSGNFGTWTNNNIGDTLPTSSGFKPSYQANTADEFDNYFGQLTGWFVPPATGNYVFFVASDDHGELYLSSDENPANKKRIAVEPEWGARNNWIGDADNAGTRGAEGGKQNRSDQYAETEWPTAGTVTLQQGKRYYLEVLFKEGGGGDNGGATFKLESEEDPASGTAPRLTGDLVGSYIDPMKVGPIITKNPTHQTINLGETATFSVEVDSATAVTYQWYKNNKPLPGQTSASLVIPSVGVANIGDYRVTVTNPNGNVSSNDNNSRLTLKGAFVVEAEDFNFGGGQTLPAASVMPLASSLYMGKDGLPGIDFHLTAENATGNPGSADSGRALRNGWVDTVAGVTNDYPKSPETLGNIDITTDGNAERPDFTLTQNYKIGWGDNGEWYNYTRTFPAGTYSASLGFSWDGRNTNAGTFALDLVTGDTSKIDQTLSRLAQVTVDQTGGWSSNDNVPFMNADGTAAATFTLGANSTVRLTIPGGDIDYLLFYKVGEVASVSAVPSDVPGLSGGGVSNVNVNTETKTITATVSGDAAFLKVTGAAKIKSVTLVGTTLTVVYE